ncbi:MAG: FHA domain-containing protein [Deltaproteobacteria bacterium]|nr:MAG: FHA domain-containing protein [Deltaproteobacteria bacterium]
MPKLYIMKGADKVQSLEVRADAIHIGRSPENDIQIDDSSVSRKHLIVRWKLNKPFITDLESKNGTLVNGKRIQSGREIEVKEGIPVGIGKIVISLGKECTDDKLDAMHTTGFPKGFSEHEEAFLQDRPMTAQRNMELIYKASGALMQSININEDIHKILEKILNYILDLLQRVDRGAFILVDSETKEISELVPILKKSNGDGVRSYSRTIVDRVMREGKAVVMSDTFSEDKADLSESMEIMKVRSVMCVPLISRSQVRGVIYVDSINQPYGFRKEDLSLLSALSIPAAFAIENASIHSNVGG